MVGAGSGGSASGLGQSVGGYGGAPLEGAGCDVQSSVGQVYVRAAEPVSSASPPATSMAALATVSDGASAMSGAERVDHGGCTDGHEKTGKPILTLENMLQVAAQVLQATPSSTGTASLPSMRVLRVKSVSRATVAEGEGKPCALLDSGATHALRKATSEEEWLKGELVKVALAGGQSITMRMNEAQTFLLPPTPDDGEGSKASIVPMGALVATLGYKMEWNQSRCKLIGRNGEKIKLKVRGGCPDRSEAQALNLIARLEEDKLKSLNDTVIKSRGRIREAALRLKETWFDRLRRYATTGRTADAAQAIVEAPHHVNIPMQCFEGMAVETGDETLWTSLKELGFWKRRRRKQILQSDRIVLHLFSGKGEKPQFRRLEGNGRILFPIHLENGQDVCHPALWKVLVKICAKGNVDAVIGGPPCRTFSILRHRPPGPPPLRSRTHPYGLPQLEAANRDYVNQDTAYFVRHLYLHSLATAGRVERGDVRTKEVAMALEQPADPDEYLNPENELFGTVPTFWRTPLWEIYHQENMMKITFDQHVLGQVARKPATVGTHMWSLKQLDGMQAEGNPPPWKGSSPELATWAPGLCEAIAEGLRDWGDAPRLLRMTPEQWRDHVNRGHLPYRRDCVTCVMGGGVGPRHGRVEHPEAFTLTADTSGPVKTPGEDCHARGSKRKIKYLLVARLRVPKIFLQGAGCPADDSLKEEDLPEGIPEDPMEAVLEEDEMPPRDIEEEGEEAERDPEERREGRDPGDEGLEDMVPPEMSSLVWAVGLADNKSGTVLEALQDIIAYCKSMNMPILRFHSDKSMEFYPHGTRRWLKSQGLRMTSSEGGVPETNGAAERTVRWIKQPARVLLHGARLPPDLWPYAASTAAVQQRARALGFEARLAAPFVSRVHVRQKAYDEKGTVLRPDNLRVQWLGGRYQASVTSYLEGILSMWKEKSRCSPTLYMCAHI